MPTAAPPPAPLLRAVGLCKRFGPVQALDGVSFDVLPGEVHALLGENGAGKSTAIKCITGAQPLDAGRIELLGRAIAPRSPREAETLGISAVYQEINLLQNLSVAENIGLGRLRTGFLGRIDWADARRRAKAALAKLGLELDVDVPLSSLSVATQQMVALARALDVDARVLILDEPTASLDEREVEALFEVMRRLRDQGLGLVFISHFLDQVFRMADRMTVLRNGRLVATRDVQGLDRATLLQDMLGKAFDELSERHVSADTTDSAVPPRLVARGLGARGKLKPTGLSIRPGEVLGLAGLLGSGRTETARLLFGIDKADCGEIEIDGKPLPQGAPRKSIARGLMLASEDRKAEGIFPNLTVRENILLALQARRGAFRPIGRKEGEAIAEKYIDAFNIKTPSAEAKISDLSGGNQQKALLARWLAASPKILILDEPTRGIDIGARAEIEKLIAALSAEGLSIALISSELDEETRCCHRALILRDREVVGELEGDALTESGIVKLIAARAGGDEA